jgi:tripartite ATP-independent transporter DctM subunit
MSLEIIGIIGLLVMLGLMFLGMPIAAAMGQVGFAGFWYIVGLTPGFAVVSTAAYAMSSKYLLTIIPLFVLMGLLAGNAGLSTDGYHAINKWIGHRRGGLAMATAIACAGFGAVCGDSVATATTMCSVALPEMRKYRYSDQLSLGAISAGGLLGFMIPPSLAFVLYGFFTEESIGSLFIAGILPGALIVLSFIGAIAIVCWRNPAAGPAGPASGWKERLAALYNVWGIIVLFLLVMGGMYSGFFTPSEAGAVGAFGALLLGIAKRRITWANLSKSLMETGIISGMIFLLIIGASILSSFMAVSEIPFTLARLISNLPVSPVLIMLILLLMYLVTGFFMSSMAVMVLTVPIIHPALEALGVDPIWFGVLVVLTIMIGQITPPVGIVVYAVGGMVRDVPMGKIFGGVWPFVGAMVVTLALLIIFPQIALWLPGMM